MNKFDQCPEGHICTSDCQNTKDCPCLEHEHTMTEEEKALCNEDFDPRDIRASYIPNK